MSTNKYELSLLVNGKNISKHLHKGKFFIEAYNGSEYTLKVSNSTNRRILAIVSVDGINVVDGSQADEKGPGYIVNPYSSTEIKGFRESETHAGKFKFTTKDGSYAKEITGVPTNCGVIGCIIVEEKQYDWYQTWIEHIDNINRDLDPQPMVPTPWWGVQPTWYSDKPYNAGPVSSVPSASMRCMSQQNDVQTQNSVQTYSCSLVNENNVDPKFSLGTTWGQKVYDKVDMISFDRGAIVETITLYYGSTKDLTDMGVSLVKKTNVSFPDPFPKRFCTPPKNYKG